MRGPCAPLLLLSGDFLVSFTADYMLGRAYIILLTAATFVIVLYRVLWGDC